MEPTVSHLLSGCADDSEAAGIRLWAALEPMGGPGTPVKPAIYLRGVYQIDRRWWGNDEKRRIVEVVSIDKEASQANRQEHALERRAEELDLPRIVLDLNTAEPLPSHLPRVLSGFRFPHRHADAYLRDAVLDGQPFPKTDLGRALAAATADDPDALLQWFPQSLLFGFWQSHQGKGARASQAKLARSWRSTIVGYEPATTDTKQFGLKGDALNLTLGADGRVEHDSLDESDWRIGDGSKTPRGRESAKLSEIGHGQVAFGEGGEAPSSPAAISFRAIEQTASVSFPDLRRVWCGEAERNAAARAVLVALGLVAHVDAFARPFTLRSGCDLRPTEVRWRWLGGDSDDDVTPLTIEGAIDLLRGCVARAQDLGLPVGDAWAREPLVLQPSDQLLAVIRSTYPVGD